MTDPFGTKLAFATDPGAGDQAFLTALSQVDYLLLTDSVDTWLPDSYSRARAYISRNFQVVGPGPGGLRVYRRDVVAPG